MPVSEYAEVRPRNVGEILDDGWRLYLADAPLLLTFSGLFLVPATAAVLLLLTRVPAPDAAGFLWPASTALLLLLTGLGTGAIQEAFHLWAEGVSPTVRECLQAALRRGLNHTTAQLLALLLPVSAVVWLLLPNLPPWARWLGVPVILLFSLPVTLLGIGKHAVLTAGQKNVWKAWRHASRATGRHPGKATIVLVSRVALLLFAVLNLHLFGQFALWSAEALGGFDVALPRLLCTLGNPVYAVALVALAWWLLTPYYEAVNYLFYVDARTRYEGLDLWYRVEQFFPATRRDRAGAIVFALGTALFAHGSVYAGDRMDAITSARQEIVRITRAVKEANPYPGSQRWVEPLGAVGRRLDPDGTAAQGRFRWYFKAIKGFGDRERAGAVTTLEEIAGRLALIEDNRQRAARAQANAGDHGTPSKKHIKDVVSPGGKEAAVKKKAAHKPPDPKDLDKDVKKDNEVFDARPPAAGHGALVSAVALGGLANLLLVVFLGLLVVVIVVGVVFAVRAWLQSHQAAPTRRTGVTAPSAEDMLEEPDRLNVTGLWRQSDELARAGRFLEAVRTLYLAVLALLHQAALIRYERTRTNGEYADQLRPRSGLHLPFMRLTGLFEIKWYGERACHENDYAACRAFAEDIRTRSTEPPV